jgi:hypothetical protein
VIHRLCECIVDINNSLFYKNFNNRYHHTEKIKQLKGIKKHCRCFIVGNGPSLNLNDLSLIKDENSFAANLIFQVFDKTEWRPTYYFLQDRYADTETILDGLDVKYIFIGDYYWRKRGVDNPNALCFHTFRNSKNSVKFSEDISNGISCHYTITYSMIQAAVYMGYSEIYLLGMDHNYSFIYDPNGKVIEDRSVVSHFFKDKAPKNVIANIEGMNQAYIVARAYAEKYSIAIYNATRGGKLEWFPRILLENVLKNS